MLEDSTRTVFGVFAAVSLVLVFALPQAGGAYALDTGPENDRDVFETDKIYPTKDGGREWFLDMEDPSSDGIFDPRTEITRTEEGAWRVSGSDNGKYQVRMNVITPDGEEEWKNVEITGYARMVETTGHSKHAESDIENVLQWYARSGEKHSDSDPCSGTSIKGRIQLDGDAGWKKELWHAGGYTDERGTESATDHPLAEDDDSDGQYTNGRWFGWKVIIYNIDNDSAVRMESYIDEYGDNDWKQVSELVDDGGWFATSSDREFESAECGKEKDHVLTESGPAVTFRSDDIVWDFKNLSVREIEAQ